MLYVLKLMIEPLGWIEASATRICFTLTHVQIRFAPDFRNHQFSRKV